MKCTLKGLYYTGRFVERLLAAQQKTSLPHTMTLLNLAQSRTKNLCTSKTYCG